MPEPIQFLIIGLVVLLILVILVFLLSYKKAPPDTAYFITGFGKKKILIGKAGFKLPFFQRLDKVPLNIMQVDIKTNSSVPTKEFININVDGVANIKISSEQEMLERAAQIFLAENILGITKIAQEVLEGNMREIIGQIGIVDLVHNRDEFAKKVQESAMEDMKKMGLEILNLTIQNFTDKDSVLNNLGIDKVSVIRKDAEIARANSERDVAMAKSRAIEEANKVRVEMETRTTQQDAELELEKAAMKQKADTAKANADSAYEIQKQLALSRVYKASVDAEITKREQEVLLANKEIEIKERQLDASIKKTADAEKYSAETIAQASLYKRQKDAEAKKYEEQQVAEMLKIQAEAALVKAQKDADAVVAKAHAERLSSEEKAAGILAIGDAEAQAIEKKAEAMKLMGEASVLELILNSEILPRIVGEMTKPISQAMGQISNITMYGEGNSAKLTEDITKSQVKLIDGIKDATGIDVKTLLAGLAGLVGGKVLSKTKDDEDKTK